jgi:hypothetical protein
VNLPTEPPPSDNDWLRSEDIRATRPPNPGRVGEPGYRARPAGYVWRPSDARQPHRCDLPAEWEQGAVWRCPEGHLWVVLRRREPAYANGYAPASAEWVPAWWWTRLRYGGKRARTSMGNENRVRSVRHMRPPPPAAVKGIDPLPVPPPTISPAGIPPQDFDG